MKQLGKSKDQAIGNLLRAHISKPSNPHEACKQFDPDLASAYIERKMTGPARASYETHLSECADCRQSVVALARLAADERGPISAAAAPARANWLDSISSVLRTLSAPQWAMAAAAVVVFAISLPLLLSRNETDRALPATSVAETRADEATQAEPHSVSPAASVSPGTPASNKSDDVKQNKPESNGLLATNTAREDRRESGELKKAVPENAPQSVDEIQRKNESQTVAQAPPQPGQAAPETQQAKLDADRAREQQEKDAAQPKPSPAEERNAESDKEKSRRAELAAAPPPPPAASGSGRARQSVGKLGLRDSASSEAVRPRADYRELRGKKFFLIDGTWTDKDYNPDRDLPIITLVRDSNVYKELLAKRASLKPYLSFFTETERAIIVYKGTVYKLIPQQ